MAHRRHAKRPPRRAASHPRTVHIDSALLDTARAALPPARDWTDAQVTAACVAATIKRARG